MSIDRSPHSLACRTQANRGADGLSSPTLAIPARTAGQARRTHEIDPIRRRARGMLDGDDCVCRGKLVAATPTRNRSIQADDRCERPRASVGTRVPAGRPHAGDRATGAAAHRGRDGPLSAPLPVCRRYMREARAACSTSPLRPQFANDRLVYLSFSEPGEGGAARPLRAARLGTPRSKTSPSSGARRPRWPGRTTGARGWCSPPTARCSSRLGDRYSYRDDAQDLSTTLGKVVRINARRSQPRTTTRLSARRRKARNLVVRPSQRSGRGAPSATGQLWTVEHGARGGDELNIPKPARTTAGR